MISRWPNWIKCGRHKGNRYELTISIEHIIGNKEYSCGYVMYISIRQIRITLLIFITNYVKYYRCCGSKPQWLLF